MGVTGDLRFVIVTGAAGFIGRELVRYLALQPEVIEIFCLDTKIKDTSKSFWENQPLDDEQLTEKEMRKIVPVTNSHIDNNFNPDNVEGFGDVLFDAVFHLAAHAGVRQSLAEPAGYLENNVGSIMWLMDYLTKAAAVNRWTRIVAASSSTVYGDSEPPDVAALPPKNVGRPLNPYAASKLAMELALISLPYPNLTILRLFSVYGENMREDLALNKFARQICKGETVKIYSSDEQLSRDYTYVGDVVKAFWLAAKSPEHTPRVLNVGTGYGLPMPAVLHVLAESLTAVASGDKATYGNLEIPELKYVFKPSKRYDRPRTQPEVKTTEQVIGWRARYSISAGLFGFARYALNKYKS